MTPEAHKFLEDFVKNEAWLECGSGQVQRPGN
jgi:hypothetical protein